MADIIHRIGIRAPATTVYEALATAEGVAGWWTRDTTEDGGKVNVTFRDAAGKEIGGMDYEVTTRELSLRELLETGRGRPSPDDVKIDDWN